MSGRLRFPLFLLLIAPGVLAFWLALPASAPTISGSVVDDTGPVGRAVVRVKGQASFVRTDSAGQFSLRLPSLSLQRVVAARTGHFIGGIDSTTKPLVLHLERLPSEDFEGYRWVDPFPDRSGRHNCGNCHQAIVDEWRQSGHARSATGRRFRDLYGTTAAEPAGTRWNLLAEHPAGAGVCSSCHAPTLSAAEPGFFDLRQVEGLAAQGVHCDFCHKVADLNPQGQLGLTHGRFGLKLLRPAKGQLFFGPLDDVDRDEDAYSPLYRQSRYCASCHEGIVFGVHVYSTYSEWLASPARQQGKQCQTCHMAPGGTMTNVAPGRGGIERDPQTLASHGMFAGSLADMLQQALKVSVALSQQADQGQASVQVLAGDVGHRVPTGFVDRHLVLLVEAFCAGRPVKLRDGPALPPWAGSDLAGLPGQLFAKQLKDFAGHSPTPFWKAQPEALDTRLYPHRVERSFYTFAGPVDRLRVRLLYRRFWPQTVQLKGWPDETKTVIDLVAGR